VRRLLDAGANGAATNESKQTPYEMVACGPVPTIRDGTKHKLMSASSCPYGCDMCLVLSINICEDSSISC